METKKWNWLYVWGQGWEHWVSRWNTEVLEHIFYHEKYFAGLKSMNCFLTSGWWALLGRQLRSKLQWHFQEFTFLSSPISFSPSLVSCSKTTASRKELIFTEHLQQSGTVLSTFMNGIKFNLKYYSFPSWKYRNSGHLLKVRQLICDNSKFKSRSILSQRQRGLLFGSFIKEKDLELSWWEI